MIGQDPDYYYYSPTRLIIPCLFLTYAKIVNQRLLKSEELSQSGLRPGNTKSKQRANTYSRGYRKYRTFSYLD